MGIIDIYMFVLKRGFFYGVVIGIPFTILAFVFYTAQIYHISTIIMYLYSLFVLVHIGYSIKRKSARKKYILYMSIIISQIIILSILGGIFGFSTYVSSERENTLLDVIAVSIVFGTILGILITIVRDSKKEFSAVKWLYFPITMIIISLIIMFIMV